MDCSLPGSSVHGDSSGKNTGVGCHALLQGIFPTQGLNPGLLHCRWILYCLCHQGSPLNKLKTLLQTWKKKKWNSFAIYRALIMKKEICFYSFFSKSIGIFFFHCIFHQNSDLNSFKLIHCVIQCCK